VGILCASCAGALPACEGLIREHVTSKGASASAAAWLVDGFGVPHALPATRTLVGRRPQADLVILNGSVSREHAELQRVAEGWQLRDLGSRNHTQLDGRRVEGRATLPERGVIRFGDVSFYFFAQAVALPDPDTHSVATTHAAGMSTYRYTMRGPTIDLCLLGSGGDDSGGALLFREPSASTWSEMSMSPLEFQLLRQLCVRAVAEASSPSRSRGCVQTKQLAKSLPFQSRYANEENVRQVVRRVRATLDELGATGLIEALPGRGYYVTWPVVVP
jgi:predicted component of type VI protein secretion system